MVTNDQIIEVLVTAFISCDYSRGQGVLLAMEGEDLPEIPAGIYVHRVRAGAAKDYDHLTQGIPGAVTRYFCRQFSVGAQADMRTSGVDPGRHHRAICNIDTCPLLVTD